MLPARKYQAECESVVDESYSASNNQSPPPATSSKAPPSSFAGKKKDNRPPSLHSDSGYSSRTAATASSASAASGQSTEKPSSTRPAREDSFNPSARPIQSSADATVKSQSISARRASSSTSTATAQLSPTHTTRQPACRDVNCKNRNCTMASRGTRQTPKLTPLMTGPPLHAYPQSYPTSPPLVSPYASPPPPTSSFPPYASPHSNQPVPYFPPQPRPRRPSMTQSRPASFHDTTSPGHWVLSPGSWVRTPPTVSSPTSAVRRPTLGHGATATDVHPRHAPSAYATRPVARSSDGYDGMSSRPFPTRSSSTRHVRKLSATSARDRQYEGSAVPAIPHDPKHPPRTSSYLPISPPATYVPEPEPVRPSASKRLSRISGDPSSRPSISSQDHISERLKDAEKYQERSTSGRDTDMKAELTIEERRQRRDSKTLSSASHSRNKSGTAQTTRSRTGSSIGTSDTKGIKAEWTDRGLEVSGANGDSVEVERDEEGRQKLIFVEGNGKRREHSYSGENSVKSTGGDTFAKRAAKDKRHSSAIRD